VATVCKPRSMRPYLAVALVVWLGALAVLWQFAPVRPRRTLFAEPQRVVSLSRDGRYLITAASARGPQTGPHTWRSPIRRWNVETGDCTICPISVSPSATRADAENSQEKYHLGTILASPDAQTLAFTEVANEKPCVRLLNLITSRELCRLANHNLDEARFSQNGQWLIAQPQYDSGVTVLESATGARLAFDKKLATFRGCSVFELSPDSRLLALCGQQDDQPQVEVWDLASRRSQAIFPGYARSLRFSPDCSILAGAVTDRSIRLFDVAARRVIGELPSELDDIQEIRFTPDGAIIAAMGHYGGNDANVHSTAVVTWRTANREPHSRFVTAWGSEFWVSSDTSDGSRLISQTADPFDESWAVTDLVSAELLDARSDYKVLATNPDHGLIALIDPQGKPGVLQEWLAAHLPRVAKVFQSDRRSISLRDLRSHRDIARLSGYVEDEFPWFGECRFSTDGQTLVTQKRIGDKQIDIWDMPPRKSFLWIFGWSLPAPLPVVLGGLWPKRRALL
jgi:WD40 repeat protein